MTASTPDEAAAMVARLTMNEPLLPWPELSQDMAFIAFTIRDLRARLAAQQPVIDAAVAWFERQHEATEVALVRVIREQRAALSGSVEAADTPPSGTSGHEAGAPAEPETHHANRFGHPVYVGDDWAVEQWSSGEIKVSVSDHRDPPGGQTYYFEPDLAAAIGAAAREVAGTPAAEPDWKRREHGIRTALYGTSEEVRAALVARAAEVHGQDIPAPAAEPAPAPARTGELERLRIKHREFVDVQMAQYAGEPDDLADLFPVAAEPAPDVEQAPHFGHTQDVIEDALVGAGFQDLPHLRDIVFVATEAARDALGVCQVCGSGQPGMYPSDPSADGYAGPEECSACDGTGWARALAGAGAPTEPDDTHHIEAWDSAGGYHGWTCSCGVGAKVYPSRADAQLAGELHVAEAHGRPNGDARPDRESLLAVGRLISRARCAPATDEDLTVALDALDELLDAAALAGSADDTREDES